MSELDLKKRIFEINAMNIPQIDKSKMIFAVMNPKKEKEMKKVLYCSHYNKYNYLVSKCCKKVYPCRLCHNENEDHEINRHNNDYVKCDFCKCIQKKNSSCKNNECYKYNKSHQYYCDKCNLWTNTQDNNKIFLNSMLIHNINTNKEYFHCNKCGICRIGKKKDYVHCDKCNLCLHSNIYDNHVCKINMIGQNCPICLKSVWNTFNKSSTVLKCGHSVHQECFMEALQSENYFCSLCKKSIIDLSPYWRMIDLHLENQEMPEEFSEWTSDILCNDCELKSNVKYNFVYHKCSNCNGYNTVIEKLNKNV